MANVLATMISNDPKLSPRASKKSASESFFGSNIALSGILRGSDTAIRKEDQRLLRRKIQRIKQRIKALMDTVNG